MVVILVFVDIMHGHVPNMSRIQYSCIVERFETEVLTAHQPGRGPMTFLRVLEGLNFFGAKKIKAHVRVKNAYV